jgi:hypothetical protein
MIAYHIVQELCNSLNIEIKLVSGSTQNYATFRLRRESRSKEFFNDTQKTIWITHGTCFGAKVTISSGHVRREFDLHDPDSISKLSAWLKSDRGWSRTLA